MSYDITGFVNVAVAGTSANGAISGAVATSRTRVLLVSDTNLYWNSGLSTVTATTNDKFLPANTPLEVLLPLGHDNIGAIRKSADGTLTIYTLG